MPLEPLRIRGLRGFTPLYNRHHQVGLFGERSLFDPFDPQHLLVQKKLRDRDRNALWWQTHCGLGVSPKAVVRVWCARRLRHAFREALDDRGLDWLARPKGPKGDDGGMQQDKKKPKAAILGYLRLKGKETLITMKYDTIKEECRLTVDELLKEQERKRTAKIHGSSISKHLSDRMRPDAHELHSSSRLYLLD
ncbi:hypothetical protein BDY21DRAFT_352588 [Lineolata rhizophorae]|uniref:Uncharacterized protein n=1 Tax=Lineolata rhizophorae TaxID=578093 RepID=A0A6A6NTG7_9PEZI|nr:hypothetical protein BDY21DRAFT_352588 [Lineolata rhizophorae]